MNAVSSGDRPSVEINGEMISLAREREALTQKQLSEDVGASVGLVSRLENRTLRSVSADLAERIALRLRVPVSFFTRFPSVRHLGFHRLYRMQRKVSAKDFAKLEAELNARRLHYVEMHRLLEVGTSLTLPDAELFTELGPVGAARRLREMWGVRRGPITDLTGLLEAAGIIVIEVDAPTDAFQGLAVHAYGVFPMIFVPRVQPDDRRRLTLAHELGHLLLHEAPTAEQEKEAMAFAAEFLIPEPEARSALSGFNLEVALRVKRQYRVSMQALIYRAEQLGMISAARKGQLFRYLTARGWRKDEPFSQKPEPVRLASELLRQLRIELSYSVEDIAEAFHETPERIKEYYFPDERRPEAKLSIIR